MRGMLALPYRTDKRCDARNSSAREICVLADRQASRTSLMGRSRTRGNDPGAPNQRIASSNAPERFCGLTGKKRTSEPQGEDDCSFGFQNS